MRRAVLPLLPAFVVVFAVALATWSLRVLDLGVDDLHPNRHRVSTVVFVVLDNVRADHLRLCGYGRPTSRRLESLSKKGARYTCEAYAPGSWTLPSHASFFTGLDVPAHGAHSMPTGGAKLGRSTSESVRPLGTQAPTLAELMSERGYQTVLVSGNPVVSPESGLTRGFDHTEVAEGFNKLHGRKLDRAVKKLLKRVDPERPLFLFVNIADAHQPWREVPDSVSWLPARETFRLRASDPTSFWQRWYRGELDAEEQREQLAHLTDVYDYGIYRADRTLGRVLRRVEKAGFSPDDLRLVVTSDHGEFLGEHGRLDHGHYLDDENQQVLLLVSGPGVGELPDGPLSATEAYHLALDGRLGGVAVSAATYPHRQRQEWSGGRAYGLTSAAQWSADGKVVWYDDESAVPTVLAPLVERVRQSGARPTESNAAVIEMLRAAGYVE